jgi:hypothetical protein
MSSTLTVTSIRSGQRRGIFAETGACFGCACTQEVKAAIGPSPNPGLSLIAWPIGVCSFLAFATVSFSPRHRLAGLLKESMYTQELAQGVPRSIHSRVSIMNFS